MNGHGVDYSARSKSRSLQRRIRRTPGASRLAQYDGKIFCIGFYKTGTTSLYDALRILGYRTINGDRPGSYPGADDGETLLKQITRGDHRLPTFDLFDAFTDAPYLWIWREIDAMFPDARYILTIRDEDAWIRSCVKFFRGRRIRPMMIWMFGKHADPSRDEASRQAWLEIYRKHNADILQHFAGREHQFMVLDCVREPGWEKLCAFLEAPIPDLPWPHSNPTRESSRLRLFRRRVMQALGLELKLPKE